MTPKQRKNNGYFLVYRYTRTEPNMIYFVPSSTHARQIVYYKMHSTFRVITYSCHIVGHNVLQMWDILSLTGINWGRQCLPLGFLHEETLCQLSWTSNCKCSNSFFVVVVPPTQIRFPIGGEHITCRGSKLATSLRQTKLTNSQGKQKMNFPLTHDQTMLLETGTNLWASQSKANNFFTIFSSFELGGSSGNIEGLEETI